MTNYIFAKRLALAPSMLATVFAFSAPLRAADAQRPPKEPGAETPDQRPADQYAEKEKMNERNCKKIYRIVHRGPPGKGADLRVLDRVECPMARA